MFKFCPLYVNGSKLIIEEGDMFRITIEYGREDGTINSEDGTKTDSDVTLGDSNDYVLEIDLKDRMLSLLRESEGLTSRELSERTGKSRRTIMRYIRVLRSEGLVDYRGSLKTGKYFYINYIIISRRKKVFGLGSGSCVDVGGNLP